MRLLKLRRRAILPDPPVTARPAGAESWVDRTGRRRANWLNEHFGDPLPDGMRFEWEPAANPPDD